MNDYMKKLDPLAWSFISAQSAHYISQQPYNSRKSLSGR